MIGVVISLCKNIASEKLKNYPIIKIDFRWAFPGRKKRIFTIHQNYLLLFSIKRKQKCIYRILKTDPFLYTPKTAEIANIRIAAYRIPQALIFKNAPLCFSSSSSHSSNKTFADDRITSSRSQLGKECWHFIFLPEAKVGNFLGEAIAYEYSRNRKITNALTVRLWAAVDSITIALASFNFCFVDPCHFNEIIAIKTAAKKGEMRSCK